MKVLMSLKSALNSIIYPDKIANYLLNENYRPNYLIKIISGLLLLLNLLLLIIFSILFPSGLEFSSVLQINLLFIIKPILVVFISFHLLKISNSIFEIINSEKIWKRSILIFYAFILLINFVFYVFPITRFGLVLSVYIIYFLWTGLKAEINIEKNTAIKFLALVSFIVIPVEIFINYLLNFISSAFFIYSKFF